MKSKSRCGWCGDDPLYVAYHDEEWGVPVYGDGRLFEFLILEGAQAGLSWITLLRKREAYRKAFANFDPHKVARFTEQKVEKLLLNPGIIRNRLKVNAAVTNARAFLDVQRSETPRFQVRRLHHNLRPHAGLRHGQRPPRLLLPPLRSVTRRIVAQPSRRLDLRDQIGTPDFVPMALVHRK